VHCYADRVWFEKSYYKIHRKIDEPVAYLGRAHRVLFHDLPSACAIARTCYPNDPKAEESACLHIYLDEVCSKDPEYKKLLEKLELLDRTERTENKKRTSKKKDSVLASFLEDMKKMAEIQRLVERLRAWR
jgi:hypothetical protein